MKRGLKILLGLVALILLIALLIWAFGETRSGPGDGDAGDAPAQPPSRVRNIGGLSALELDQAVQQQAGINTVVLILQHHLPTIAASATVMDLQPLLDLRIRHDSAQGQYQVAKASAAASHQEFERLRTLYRNDQNASLKALQAAKAAWNADQARMIAAHAASRDIRHQARQQWGKVLSDWAFFKCPLSAHCPARAPARPAPRHPARGRGIFKASGAHPDHRVWRTRKPERGSDLALAPKRSTRSGPDLFLPDSGRFARQRHAAQGLACTVRRACARRDHSHWCRGLACRPALGLCPAGCGALRPPNDCGSPIRTWGLVCIPGFSAR